MGCENLNGKRAVQYMKNIKISTRILGTFGILVALLLAMVAMALMQFRSMQDSSEVITGKALPSVEVINTRRIQTRSATPVDSVNEGGVLRAVDQQFSVHSQR